jgi:hypothetical protein
MSEDLPQMMQVCRSSGGPTNLFCGGFRGERAVLDQYTPTLLQPPKFLALG